MPARVLPVLLVLGALATDALGRSDLSFALLVASVLAAAVSALSLSRAPRRRARDRDLGRDVFSRRSGSCAWSWPRRCSGQAPDTSTLPALAASAALAALAVYGFQTLVALLGLVRVSGSEPLTSAPLR